MELLGPDLAQALSDARGEQVAATGDQDREAQTGKAGPPSVRPQDEEEAQSPRGEVQPCSGHHPPISGSRGSSSTEAGPVCVDFGSTPALGLMPDPLFFLEVLAAALGAVNRWVPLLSQCLVSHEEQQASELWAWLGL